jgi:rhodanese-related sulfurtransferase
MVMKKIFLLLIVGLFLAACQSTSVTGEKVAVGDSSYNNVTPQELKTMLEDKDFVLINVHIPFAGNIAGTDQSIAYDVIDQNLSQLPAKDAKIVLYCRSGHMSQIAAEKLVALGYTNIWNLNGGMIEWEKQGFDLEK